MVDKAASCGKTFLVPISPGKAAVDALMPVYEARVECKNEPPLLSASDAPFAATLLDALYELGVPDKLHHWPGACEWRGLVWMEDYKGALNETQARHFKQIQNTEGFAVLVVNQEAICKMPTLENLRVLPDRIASDVTTSKKNVSIMKTVQEDMVYKAHEMPVLTTVTQPSATTMRGYFQRMYAKVFMLHFICPVCARKGAGYRLVRAKKEVAVLGQYVKYTLLAIEIISLMTPVPLPYLSQLATYLPSNDMITELGLSKALVDKTQASVDKNLKNLSNRTAGGAEVEMTLAEVHQLMELLRAMKETVPPLRTGLHPVLDRDANCAWVCQEPHKDDQGNVVLDCSQRFKECGNACLQIRIKKI